MEAARLAKFCCCLVVVLLYIVASLFFVNSSAFKVRCGFLTYCYYFDLLCNRCLLLCTIIYFWKTLLQMSYYGAGNAFPPGYTVILSSYSVIFYYLHSSRQL